MNVLSLLNNNYINTYKMNLLQRIIMDSTNRLSSGKKLIKDNPSDILRISRFDSEIRGNQIAQSNIQDGVSLIQTTDNALESINNIGKRLKDLSITYNNETLSSDDKSIIEKEAKELTNQIGNIVKNTSYNGKNVFSSNSVSIMAGNTSSDMINIHIPELKTTLNSTSSTKYVLPIPNFSNFPDLNGYTGPLIAYDNNGNEAYNGEATNGLFDGNGTYNENGIKFYEGNWSNGVYNGYGTLYNTNGTIKYQGNTINGTPDGYGKYYTNNGIIQYAGNFNNGYTDSSGTTYDASGSPIIPPEFSLKDIASFDVKELLKTNFVDNNVLKPVASAQQELGTTEEMLNFRIEYLQKDEVIKTDALSRIEDVDTAKEMLNLTKAQVLLNVNVTLNSQINDMAQNMVKMLLN